MSAGKKPNRRALVRVIATLQGLVGDARMYRGNDQDLDGFEKGQDCLDQAFDLCVESLAFDPPQKITSKP